MPESRRDGPRNGRGRAEGTLSRSVLSDTGRAGARGGRNPAPAAGRPIRPGCRSAPARPAARPADPGGSGGRTSAVAPFIGPSRPARDPRRAPPPPRHRPARARGEPGRPKRTDRATPAGKTGREEARRHSAARSIPAERKATGRGRRAPAGIESGKLFEVPTPQHRLTLRLDARDGAGFGAVAGRVARGGKEPWP
jgi:hypothetical protein